MTAASDNVEERPVVLRHELRPGDLGWIVGRHGTLYAEEHGFDATFEAYVAGPLAEFVRNRGARGRLWIAEEAGRRVGCIAVVAAGPDSAQLRWFLVEPAVRGKGVGKRLLREALSFCAGCGFHKVSLWTVSALEAAAHLYRGAGFRKVEEKLGRPWSVAVVQERYELVLA